MEADDYHMTDPDNYVHNLSIILPPAAKPGDRVNLLVTTATGEKVSLISFRLVPDSDTTLKMTARERYDI